MIRPREFEVDNGEGIKPDIRIDPETLMNDELFFEIDQDSETVTVTLDCLRGLVAAAEELAKTRKPLTTKDCCCGKPEAIGVVHRADGPCYMDEKAPQDGLVAWMVYTEDGKSAYVTDNPTDLVGAYRALPLYTDPPQRQPLIADEICDSWEFITGHQIQFGPSSEGRPMYLSADEVIEFARAIEAAHGIGGQDGQK